jgi:hypothetical protein
MAPNRPLLQRAAGFRLLSLGLVALSLLALAACGKKPLQVVYYYKAGTPDLARMLADVAALEKEFPGQVTARSIDASSPDAQRDLTALEIGTSGIAVRNSNSVMIFKQGGSALDMVRVKEAIRGALGIKAP